jgi:hypothetical protein
MAIQTCPLHGFDDIIGTPVEDAPGAYEYVCPRADVHHSRPRVWLEEPESSGPNGLSALALDLGLDVALPSALQQFGGSWVEYGVLERAYALAQPEGFQALIDKYGHRRRTQAEGGEPGKYTLSMFLAGSLGQLAKKGYVDYHNGPATGYWGEYLTKVSWWALPPGPDWTPEHRVSVEDSGASMDYVLPGS